MSPPAIISSSFSLSGAAPRHEKTSNSFHSIPKTLSCDFWIGNPGSIKRTLSLPGIRWVQAMKAPNEAATEPVVGMQLSGGISILMNALMKSLAAFFNSGTPAAGGYWLPTPSSRAFFSASTPKRFTGSPGEPWSIRMNGIPVFSSRYCDTSRTSPIVALERSATAISLHASATCSSEKILIY